MTMEADVEAVECNHANIEGFGIKQFGFWCTRRGLKNSIAMCDAN